MAAEVPIPAAASTGAAIIAPAEPDAPIVDPIVKNAPIELPLYNIDFETATAAPILTYDICNSVPDYYTPIVTI